MAAAGVVFGSVEAGGEASLLATAAGTLTPTGGVGGTGAAVVAGGAEGGAGALGTAAGTLT